MRAKIKLYRDDGEQMTNHVLDVKSYEIIVSGLEAQEDGRILTGYKFVPIWKRDKPPRNKCYRDKQMGDYLVVFDADKNTPRYDGRGPAIRGLVTSVGAVSIGRQFLNTEFVEVSAADVPEDWRKALGINLNDTESWG